MSFSLTLQEVTQGGSGGGTRSHLLQNEQAHMPTKQDSNICKTYANLEPAEAGIESQPSSARPSVWPTEGLNAATLKENTAGYTRESTNSRFTEAPSSLEQADQREASDKNVDHELSSNSGGLHDAHASSQLLDTVSGFLVSSNLNNIAEAAVSPTKYGVGLKENALNGDTKPMGLHTSWGIEETSGAFAEDFADFSKMQLPSQESGVAVVVSTDLDGWHRFESEENKGNAVSEVGCNRAIDGELVGKRALWEQLLEEGSEEDGETQFRTSISQVEAETGIGNAMYGSNQFWLASPGNPFIEGPDRLSNFSEPDNCTANEFLAKSQVLECFETSRGLPFKEGPFQNNHTSDNFLQENLVEGNLGSHLNGLHNYGGKQHTKPRFPSFSDLRRSSSKSKDPSCVSFSDQVPAFQGSNQVHGFENGGEKWEANFDLMAPPAQEGPRSLSLPREASDSQAQRQKKKFSLFSREAPARSQQLKPSGISSPKLSSTVKKVANKVQTKPKEELNAVDLGKSSNTMDKEPKKRIWRCCICCSHGS